MGEARQVTVTVEEKDVYGSLSSDTYEDDKVTDVISWLQEVLADIPIEYRDSAKISVNSVRGYEDEHHTEVSIYYKRPESVNEIKERK